MAVLSANETLPLQIALRDAWNRGGGPKYPHEKVVQFCFRNYPPAVRPGVHALDLGCGSGVHTVFLASEGFSTVGLDVSAVGVANTRDRLATAGLTAETHVMDIAELDFPLECFDLVVCVGIFECAGFNAAQSALRRLVTQMAPGGRGLFLFAAESDFRYRSEPPLIPFAYSRAEVETLFTVGFSQVWIDRYLTTYRGESCEQSEWLVTVEK